MRGLSYRIHFTLALLILFLVPACARQTAPQRPSVETGERLTNLATGPVRFAIIGDYGTQGEAAADVAALVQSWNVDFVSTVGDNNYDDGAASTIDANVGQYYQAFIKPYLGSYGTGSPDINRFWPALGNHDWNALSCIEDSCSGPYFDYFDLPNNERYYDVEIGPVHLFILDSDAREPDGISSTSLQAQWLQNRLAASSALHKIVLLHHAPYTSGSAHGSNPEVQWPFEAWGATAVVAGHEHIYERLQVGGIPYFVNGAGGRYMHGIGTPLPESQLQYRDDRGAMLIEAEGRQIRYQFINRSGTVVDSFLQQIGGAAPTTLVRQVSAGRDDAAEQANGRIDFNSRALELDPTSGVRFNNVTIPRGATILEARLEFTAASNASEPVDLHIKAEASDNALTFSKNRNDISSRPTTDTAASWTDSPVWSRGESYATPDLSAVIEEVTSRSGWRSGNALAFILTGTGRRTAESFNGSREEAPRLIVTYSLPNQPPVASGVNVNTVINTPVAIPLVASDPDGDTLTYEIVTAPENGLLSGDAPNLSYTPAADFVGSDSFTFSVNDGRLASNLATVTIEVRSEAQGFTLRRQISSSSDDAEERSDANLSLTSSDLELTDDVEQNLLGQTVGLRFTDITVPQGAIILEARIDFRVDEEGDAPTTLELRAEATANAATFESTSANISSRPTTASVVDWTDVPAWSTVGSLQTTPDLSPIVQEVVSRGNWQSGNALAVIISGTGWRTAESYDGSRLDAPKLILRYSLGANTPPSLDAPGDQNNVEGEEVTLQLSASDADEDSLTYGATGLPPGLSLNTESGLISGTLAVGAAGSYSVSVSVTDGGEGDSASFTWTVQAAAVNHAPVAQPQSLTLMRNTSLDFMLEGSDIDGDPLSYSILIQPEFGTLSGEAPNLTYTPSTDFSGTDSLVFRVNDGELDSEPATITLDVQTDNSSAPVATDSSFSTLEDTAIALTLVASDADGNALSYEIVQAPQYGSLSGSLPNLVYTPSSGYTGTDSFRFRASDGEFMSNLATVDITVLPANNFVTLNRQIGSSSDDAEERPGGSLSLGSSDLELTDDTNQNLLGQTVGLRFTDITVPQGATILDARIEFRVDEASLEPASLQFKAEASDNAATFSSSRDDISGRPTTVATVAWNDVPAWPNVGSSQLTPSLAAPVQEVVDQGTWQSGNALAFIIAGTGRRTAESYDGLAASAAKLTLSYRMAKPDNEAPSASDASYSTFQDTAVAVTLSASDPDGDSLSYEIVSIPQHGSLSGSAPNWTYTPAPGYLGLDSFTFSVNDGFADSNVATVSLNIEQENADAPLAQNASYTTTENTPVDILLSASDANGDPLSYTLLRQPEFGSLSGTAPALTYRPDTDYRGNDSFSFVANDGSFDSNIATISLLIERANTAPTATPQSLSLFEDAGLHIVPDGSDIDGDPLSFEVIDLPENGRLTQQTLTEADGSMLTRLIYKPDLRYTGPDSFRFVMNDGLVDSEPATIDLTVLPVAQPPNGGLGNYDYRIIDPLPYRDDKLRFIITSDSHQKANETSDLDTAVDAMVERTNSWLPNGFLHAGDMGDVNDKAENIIKATSYFELMRRPVLLAMGNHDVMGQDTNNVAELEQIPLLGQFPFWRYQMHSSGDGSFNALVVHMDDNYYSDATLPGRVPPCMQDGDYFGDPEPYNGTYWEWKRQFSQPQLDWLERTLANHPSDMVILIHHHPEVLIADYPDMLDILSADGRFAMAIHGHRHSSAKLRTKTYGNFEMPVFNMMGMRETGAWAELVLSKTATGIEPNIKIDNYGTIAGEDLSNVTAVPPVVFKTDPVANSQSLITEKNTVLEIILSADDPDGDPLSYSIAQQPKSGTLSGTPPNLSYRPKPDFTGEDSFDFVASDGETSSAPATISITVTGN